MDKLEWQEQMALPAYLKSVPRTMGDTTFTFAHFIVDAQEGLPRNRFIKSMLCSLPGYLERFSARQKQYAEENGGEHNRDDYVEITDDEAEGSNNSSSKNEEDMDGLAEGSASGEAAEVDG
jgi:hypothetical protein